MCGPTGLVAIAKFGTARAHTTCSHTASPKQNYLGLLIGRPKPTSRHSRRSLERAKADGSPHPGHLRPATRATRDCRLGRQAPIARADCRADTLDSTSLPVQAPAMTSQPPRTGRRMAPDAGALNEIRGFIAVTHTGLESVDAPEPFHVLSRTRLVTARLDLAEEVLQTTEITSPSDGVPPPCVKNRAHVGHSAHAMTSTSSAIASTPSCGETPQSRRRTGAWP